MIAINELTKRYKDSGAKDAYNAEILNIMLEYEVITPDVAQKLISSKKLDFKEVRGIKGVKEAEYIIGKNKIKVLVASGLGNIKPFLDYNMYNLSHNPPIQRAFLMLYYQILLWQPNI